jgi:hypothetical protein
MPSNTGKCSQRPSERLINGIREIFRKCAKCIRDSLAEASRVWRYAGKMSICIRGPLLRRFWCVFVPQKRKIKKKRLSESRKLDELFGRWTGLSWQTSSVINQIPSIPADPFIFVKRLKI